MIRPAPGLAPEQQSEKVVVRLCLADEARGEKDASGDLDALPMLAIWHVIRNRALARDTTMKAEVLRPWQFSGFNQQGGHREQMLHYWQNDATAWTRADAVCDLAEAGFTVDPTEGANHYYALSMKEPPKWGRGHPTWNETVVLGGHVFGKQA